MKITLSQTELSMACMSGADRLLQNHKNGTNTQAKKLDRDITGMAGEIAVAKYFNRYPDFTVGPHHNGYDLMVAGKKVEVKTTSYKPGLLQQSLKKKVTDADVYVLVHIDLPHCEIMGGIAAEDFIHQSNVRDTGYGNMYTMESSQLRPLKTFWRHA